MAWTLLLSEIGSNKINSLQDECPIEMLIVLAASVVTGPAFEEGQLPDRPLLYDLRLISRGS